MTKKEIQDKNIATSNLDNKNPALEGNFSNKNIEESIKKPAEDGYEENKKDEYNNDVKFEEISERTSRIMALGSAMGAVDLGKIEERKFRIGACVGSSGNNQAVAVGVGYAPTDRFRVNTKFSTSSTSKKGSAISIGASVDLDW